MRLLRALALLAPALVAGCASARATTPIDEPVRVVAPEQKPTLALPELDAPEAPRGPVTRNVLLVAIDGVRFQEIFSGVDLELAQGHVAKATGEDLAPNLWKLGRSGVILGAPDGAHGVFATGPNFASLPGYTEMMTGKAPECQSNECPPTRDETWLDVCAKAPGHQAGDTALVSSWENLALVASRSPDDLPVSAGRHHVFGRDLFGKEMGAMLRRHERGFPMPGHEDYRADKLTREIALKYVETRAPRCMFIGLGDTDEYAHQDDYKSYVGALRRFDTFLGDLTALLGRMGTYGAETTIVVTTDHGRAIGFRTHGHAKEASRVFLFAGGGAVPKRGLVTPSHDRSLSDIPSTLLALSGLSSGRPGIPELLP